MTNLFIVWQNRRKKIMSYREELSKRILELEEKISSDIAQKSVLERELNRLRLAEFEEEMKESQEQRLLKG